MQNQDPAVFGLSYRECRLPFMSGTVISSLYRKGFVSVEEKIGPLVQPRDVYCLVAGVNLSTW